MDFVLHGAAASGGGLDEERARLYLDLVLGHLNEAARAALGAMMQGNYEYQSDFAKKYYGQGHQEGRQEGRHQEAREALIDVLKARRFELTAQARKRMDACVDLPQLKRWHRRAVSASSLDDVFATETPSRRRARGKKPRGS